MGLLFTTIRHRFRKENNLSCNEYVLADMIYQLSTSPESKIKGWCYMSRVKMADEFGLTKQSILNLIDSLVDKGFIIKDEETSFLKTTKDWNLIYFNDGKESLPPVKKVVETCKESLPKWGKESLPYNNNLDNNIDIKKDIGLFSDLISSEKETELKKALERFVKMRSAIKSKITDDALIMIKRKVLQLSKGDESIAVLILDQSTQNSWKDIYELKKETNANTTTIQPKKGGFGSLRKSN